MMREWIFQITTQNVRHLEYLEHKVRAFTTNEAWGEIIKTLPQNKTVIKIELDRINYL